VFLDNIEILRCCNCPRFSTSLQNESGVGAKRLSQFPCLGGADSSIKYALIGISIAYLYVAGCVIAFVRDKNRAAGGIGTDLYLSFEKSSKE
jgi:hypothetical protein